MPMTDLRRADIFLSASFPSGKRGKSFEPHDPAAIADAVSAFARAILGSNGRLAFGGHPTITPLILMIARELKVQKSVFIYQSKWFKDEIPPEVGQIDDEGFGFVVWTPKAITLNESLQIMRHKMINQSSKYVGAIFIGGMEGIRDEFHLVKEHSRQTPCIPIIGPGGAAARLPLEDCDRIKFAPLHECRAYPFVALRFVEILADRETGGC